MRLGFYVAPLLAWFRFNLRLLEATSPIAALNFHVSSLNLRCCALSIAHLYMLITRKTMKMSNAEIARSVVINVTRNSLFVPVWIIIAASVFVRARIRFISAK